MNLKIDMYIRVPRRDNDLVNRKEGQNEAVEVTERDRFGHERTFVIRRGETCGETFLAEIDPDFGFESSRGAYGPMDAAPDRIELPIGQLKGNVMAEEFYTVEVISHLENETGEYDYVPTFEVRIDKGGEGKSSTARRLRLERPPIAIIEDIEAIGPFGRPYISDFVDISYIVNSCRLDALDAYRILRRLDDSGSAVFEVTAAYLLAQSTI